MQCFPKYAPQSIHWGVAIFRGRCGRAKKVELEMIVAMFSFIQRLKEKCVATRLTLPLITLWFVQKWNKYTTLFSFSINIYYLFIFNLIKLPLIELLNVLWRHGQKLLYYKRCEPNRFGNHCNVLVTSSQSLK